MAQRRGSQLASANVDSIVPLALFCGGTMAAITCYGGLFSVLFSFLSLNPQSHEYSAVSVPCSLQVQYLRWRRSCRHISPTSLGRSTSAQSMVVLSLPGVVLVCAMIHNRTYAPQHTTRYTIRGRALRHRVVLVHAGHVVAEPPVQAGAVHATVHTRLGSAERTVD